MSVRAQCAAIDPCMRQGIQNLIAISAKHTCHYGRRRDTNQQHVVEANSVVAILKREHALNFMRLDHCGQHVAHRQRIFARRSVLPAQIIGNGKDASGPGNYSLGTVAHEIGHAIWKKEEVGTSGNPAKAMNEGHGDVLGGLTDIYQDNTDGQGDWLYRLQYHEVFPRCLWD